MWRCICVLCEWYCCHGDYLRVSRKEMTVAISIAPQQDTQCCSQTISFPTQDGEDVRTGKRKNTGLGENDSFPLPNPEMWHWSCSFPFCGQSHWAKMEELSRKKFLLHLTWTRQSQEKTQVPSLGRGEPREEETATHSGTLAWRTPRTEEPGGLQSMRSQKNWTWLSD